MTERIHIRVTKDGDMTNREFIADQYKWGDLSYADTICLIDQAMSYVRHGKVDETLLKFAGRDFRMSYVEALEFIMQATSSLRW
jgi:hypothetical protein